MKVSVIIPNFNHARYLRQRIDSILTQTLQDFELIILDDKSNDYSMEIIREYAGKYPEIIQCFNEVNSGNPFSQWNKGVNMARGEFIWIAESDDFADPHFLEKTYCEIIKSEKIGMVCCDLMIINEEKGIEYKYSDRSKVSRNIVRKLSIKDLVENHIPNVSSVLFRKASFMNCGGADPKFEYCGDWFLYLNILQNWEIFYLPETLSTFRLHEGSKYHNHYISNTFLKEKIVIYSYILKSNAKTAGLMFRIIFGIGKTALLRLMYMLRLPSFFIPEIPRRPKKFNRYSLQS